MWMEYFVAFIDDFSCYRQIYLMCTNLKLWQFSTIQRGSWRWAKEILRYYDQIVGRLEDLLKGNGTIY